MNLGTTLMAQAMRMVNHDRKGCLDLINQDMKKYGIPKSAKLLTKNAKLDKVIKGYLNCGHFISAHKFASENLSSVMNDYIASRIDFFKRLNTCPMATTDSIHGCSKVCLMHSSGLNILPVAQQAKVRKTLWLAGDTLSYFMKLYIEISNFRVLAYKKGLKPCIRLNGTSDILWEVVAPEIFEEFDDVQFYDYTKFNSKQRAENPFPNYNLTMSYKGINADDCKKRLDEGGRVAVIFNGNSPEDFPVSFMGHKVVDGYSNDATFLKEPGTVQGLLRTGELKKKKYDESVFIGDNVESVRSYTQLSLSGKEIRNG